MRKENENKQQRKRDVTSVECAEEFQKNEKHAAEKHRDIEINSGHRQRKDNFEFARDNYRFNEDGSMPYMNYHNQIQRDNSSYELDSLRDKQRENGIEYEFADDLYETSNNLNNQRNQSTINENRNKKNKK